MKKVLSMVMVFCMLISCLAIPVAATEAEPMVTIGEIAEGDIYGVGANIIISVDASTMSDVKNVDIYANGDKLPGTVIGSTGTYIWYAPAAGRYAVTAKAVTADGAEEESAAVNLTVSSDAAPRAVMSKFNSFADMANWTKNYGNAISEKDVSAEYAAFSPLSFKVTGAEAYAIELINPTATSMNSGDYIVVPFYNASEVEGAIFSLSTNRWGVGSDYQASERFTLKKGWNFPMVDVNNTGGVSSCKVWISAEYNGANYRVGTHGVVELYINGAYVVNNANNFVSQTLAVESTSIPNGQENVCNDLKRYRITFDEAIVANANSVTVTNVTDSAEVTEFTVAAGTDYIDVNFADGALAFGKEYKVSVNSNVTDVLGLGFAGADYTFTTIADDCTGVKPIVNIVYPADGAGVTANAKLAAKVIFRSNVSKVEFFNGDSSLGEAIEYSNGEYQLDVTLPAAETYNIKAVATLKDNTTIEDTIALTGATATDYAVIGIGDGERIMINNGATRKVSVIDLAKKNTSSSATNKSTIGITNATNVNKVEFYVDNALAGIDTNAPYSFEIPVGGLGTHTAKIHVVDIYGNITDFEYDFTTVLGIVDKSDCKDFEEPYTVDQVAKAGFENLQSDPNYQIGITTQTGLDGTASKVLDVNYTVPANNTAGAAQIALANLVNTSGKLIHYEFDVYRKIRYGTPSFILRKGNLGQTNLGQVFAIQQEDRDVFKQNRWYKIAIDIDTASKAYTVYIDGDEFYRGALAADITDAMLVANYYNSAVTAVTNKEQGYFDNIKAYSYTVVESVPEDLYVTREDTKVFAYNDTNAEASFVVINAEYDSSDRLVAAPVEIVTVPAYGIVNKTYTVEDNHSLFILNSLNKMVPLTEALKK